MDPIDFIPSAPIFAMGSTPKPGPRFFDFIEPSENETDFGAPLTEALILKALEDLCSPYPRPKESE